MFGKKKNNAEEKPAKRKSKEPAAQEPQYYRSPVGEDTLNYKVYYMKPLEKVAYFVLAFIAGAAVGYLFYGGIGKDEYGDPTTLTHVLNAIIMCVCGFITGKVFIPMRTKQIITGRQRKLRTQFRDMLDALSTALGAGKNVRDAFVTVEEDLGNQYEEGSYILNELNLINNGVENGVTLEQLLKDFAWRSGSEDITDFADVFEICYRQGGNIRETVQNTCQIIGDKMSVAEEIETTVSGSKSEQYIMLVMPIGLIGLIKAASAEFAANFATPSGIMATTVGIVLFALSYYIGTKVLDIKV